MSEKTRIIFSFFNSNKNYTAFFREEHFIVEHSFRSYQLIHHRINGPANTMFYKNGRIKYIEYWNYGSLHRLDGPAIIYYGECGKIKDIVFYINNIVQKTKSLKKFFKIVKMMNIQ